MAFNLKRDATADHKEGMIAPKAALLMKYRAFFFRGRERKRHKVLKYLEFNKNI